MDFKSRRFYSFPSNIPMPYYMSYPGYMGAKQEQEILKDLEYLQQTYPTEVKRYQRKVAEVLDKMDYEGSMIYDEYPDRYTLQRLAKTVTQIIKREMEDTETFPPEKWEWLEDMVQVLVCNEVYKRRHGGRRVFW